MERSKETSGRRWVTVNGGMRVPTGAETCPLVLMVGTMILATEAAERTYDPLPVISLEGVKKVWYSTMPD